MLDKVDLEKAMRTANIVRSRGFHAYSRHLFRIFPWWRVCRADARMAAVRQRCGSCETQQTCGCD